MVATDEPEARDEAAMLGLLLGAPLRLAEVAVHGRRQQG